MLELSQGDWRDISSCHHIATAYHLMAALSAVWPP
jgi:hypothetical protein